MDQAPDGGGGTLIEIDEAAKTFWFRAEQFEAMGFSPVQARILARSDAVIARVRASLKRGCDQGTAFRIFR